MQNQSLPIEIIHQIFFTALRSGNVVVQSPTGSGKSTQLPLWCAQRGKVLVVEPRRLACRSLSRYVAQLSNSDVGQEIGYAIRFENQYCNSSKIIFVTPGIALRWLAENQLKYFSTIILDEFHERRWDTDLLAALLRNRAKEQRIVITSATVDAERLGKYLDGPCLTAEGRMFPVQVRYTDENSLPTIKHLEQRLATALQSACKQNDGDVLVFLPGRGEIHSALSLLKGKIDAELIPLHAGISNDYQDKALHQTDHRRIILATNVAETSLTIPGIKIVIDSGLERRTHHRNARTVLALHSISQAAAEQRCGRAGRLGPGLCIRLWGKNAKLEPFTPPEIQREELTELVLAAAAAGAQISELQFPDKLPSHALQKATGLLQSMHALDKTGRITSHGKRLHQLPIDALFAHLITAMPDQNTRQAMIDLTAALTINARILQTVRSEYQQNALQQWEPNNCDFITLIRLLREKAPAELPVNIPAIKEARRIAEHIRAVLKLPKPPKHESIQRQALLGAIAKASPELVYIRREKRRNAMGNGFTEVEVGSESRFEEAMEAGIVLDQHSKPAKGMSKTINIASCIAPVSLPWLNALDIGEIQDSAPFIENGTLYVNRQRVYAGRIIQNDMLEPVSHSLRTATAQLILDGKLLSPAGQTVRDDIEAWNLYLVINKRDGANIVALDWLVSRLKQLGVESNSDLELIEPQDLCFQGIPPWEREQFDQRFPRQIKLANLHMTAHYNPKKKQVTVEKIQGIRKQQPQRKELPVWSGWSIRYRDGSKIIDIK